MKPYTLGLWTTKPGCEEQFMDVWAEFSEWTSREFPGIAGTLLQDLQEPMTLQLVRGSRM